MVQRLPQLNCSHGRCLYPVYNTPYNNDMDYYVPWYRHLLIVTCLQYFLGGNCLVGARAVTFNPHFPYFHPRDSSDSDLGSSLRWPAESALLLLDSLMPSLREAIIQQVYYHTHEVWIIIQDQPSHQSAADMELIRGKRTRLVAVIPANSLVLHSSSCWSDAKWDETPSKYATQIWNLPRAPGHYMMSPVVLKS